MTRKSFLVAALAAVCVSFPLIAEPDGQCRRPEDPLAAADAGTPAVPRPRPEPAPPSPPSVDGLYDLLRARYSGALAHLDSSALASAATPADSLLYITHAVLAASRAPVTTPSATSHPVDAPLALAAGSSLRFSGFGDLCLSGDPGEPAPVRYGCGQLEMGVEADLDGGAEVALAIAYDESEGQFGLGVFTVGMPLTGAAAALQAGLTVGQFDVPVGIAPGQYASIDRLTVSMPLAIDAVHQGWNSPGAALDLGFRSMGASVFAVRGMVSGAIAPDVDEQAWSGGARFTWSPLAPLAVGITHARSLDSGRRPVQDVSGIDMLAEFGVWDVRGEWLWRNDRLAGLRETVNGGYAQISWQPFPMMLNARLESLRGGAEPARLRMCLGGGYRLFEQFLLRGEWQRDSDGPGRMAAQLVVGF